MSPAEALAFLAGHVNLEVDPAPAAAARRLDRVRRVLELLGQPQLAYPAVHITGTNGKGSTARILTSLLQAQGLSVGTYTSPHLQRVNERLAWGGEPIGDEDFAGCMETIARVEPHVGSRPTYFEVLTAAALSWFADVAVDVAVVEVGLGGRWDATNVVDGRVAVVTNVSLDHEDTIGPGLTDIAAEKAGIVKADSTLVLGETRPELRRIFEEAGAKRVWLRSRDFSCRANHLAHEGRLLALTTPGASYEDVHLPAHGGFQGENAAVALAAAEAFLEAPLDRDVVAEAFAAVRLPGRVEVMSRQPLCVVDGAHNPAGAAALSAAVAETFGRDRPRVLVVGMLEGRDPTEMLAALDVSSARLVVACSPSSPRALPASVVADAARALGAAAEEAASVPQAVATALALAAPGEIVLVAGSLYVVGAARDALGGR